MTDLSDEQIAELWHRSYTSVDGLWFMKVEEKYGFQAALEIDNEVWKVMPKVQARVLKSMVGVGGGMEALYRCLAAKFGLEGFTFHREPNEAGDELRIVVTGCPWHDMMLKSNRGELSGQVGALICPTEYAVWAAEFGAAIRFEMEDLICTGGPSCVLVFRSAPAP